LSFALRFTVGVTQVPIDPDPVDAFGSAFWLFEICDIAHRFSVEQHQIRPVTFPHESAFMQAEASGGQAGHLVDGSVQGKQSNIAAEMPQDPRECAPQARMRKRIFRQAIRADHRQRVLHDALHVILIHAVIHGACWLQLARGVFQRQAPVGGDVLEVATALVRMRRRPGDGDAMSIGHLFQIQRRGTGSVGIAITADRVSQRGLFQRCQ